MEKFGYPATLIKEYDNWCVLLRGKQATLGSLVLVEKSEATNYGQITEEAFKEQRQAVADIESTLEKMFGPQKFNYLMLMMVDPNVHFHVLPRYESDKTFEGVTFKDTGWPKPPVLGDVTEIDDATREKLLNSLKENWPQ